LVSKFTFQIQLVPLHRGNIVQLDCPRVPSLLSRQHAEIKIDAAGVHSVTDKNTLNGTYLNGNLIPKGPCPLQHGDVIAFGGPANVSSESPTLLHSSRVYISSITNLQTYSAHGIQTLPSRQFLLHLLAQNRN
jgi:pSer/pThr/pTyr-binding forkhead associated (FHA) protein